MKEFIQESTEITVSILSLSLKKAVFLFAWVGGTVLGAVSAFVTDWIFDPSISYFALMALIAADYASGIALALKRNDFQTRKAARILWTLISHTALLFLSNHLSKGAESLFWFNEAVFVPLVLVNFLSLLKNLSLLGYIKRGVATFLYKKIDQHKNAILDKLETNEKNETSDPGPDPGPGNDA